MPDLRADIAQGRADGMIGRGIDQVLAQSVEPVLYEHHTRDYVALAEQAGYCSPDLSSAQPRTV